VLHVYDPPADSVTNPETDRIRRETNILRQLEQSGVVPHISDSLMWEEHHEVVPMHVPKGESFAALPLPNNPEEAILEIQRFSRAFSSLAKVHAAGVVHRAIRPDTLIVENTSSSVTRVILTGFLSARQPGNETISPMLDEAGISDPYVAPEIQQLGSYGFAEPTSDVYSLALVALERLSGLKLRELHREKMALSISPLRPRLAESGHTWMRRP
jgi:serine/threonine protein kinase